MGNILSILILNNQFKFNNTYCILLNHVPIDYSIDVVVYFPILSTYIKRYLDLFLIYDLIVLC